LGARSRSAELGTKETSQNGSHKTLVSMGMCTNTHSDVTVHDKTDRQQSVKNRKFGCASSKRGSGQRNETGREQTLKSPVVGTVCTGRGREFSWVVDRAFVNSCDTKSKSSKYLRSKVFKTHDHQGHRDGENLVRTRLLHIALSTRMRSGNCL
jgi:hypothetical protein